ncbi:MAG: hypothetical protein MSH15_06310 [Oscillospiraceae bacterium]|nr:hypothetical protein [Oscillospiraceae bacterium]
MIDNSQDEYIQHSFISDVIQSDKSDKNLQNTVSDTDSGISKVMNSHYRYGFKIDSIRELMRFRQFAEKLSVALPDNDDALIAAIKASGTLIDGKVFCKSENLPDELNKIVTSIFSDGISVIYYSKLFEIHNEWMTIHVIPSPEMLKEYLQKHITYCHFSKTFLISGSRQTERNAVTEEIIRVWGDSQVRTVDSLSDNLPYIPIGNIWRVISGNDNFVLAEEGTYLYTEKLKISDNEASKIRDYVEKAIISSGFASLNDIPLGDIEEENYEIPRIPLLNALYKRLLSADYNLNGTIITKESSSLDAVSLLKNYLKGKEQCTFEELDNELIKLTGRINRQYTFQALYDEMIRVDKEHFVANQKIKFHVSEIDCVISDFITDGFVSLKEITTFAMFPVCGSTWNHFVLESYCYKYSVKYSLHTIHFNDKNVGIIAEKDYDRKYDDMLAIALARSDIDLDSGSAGQYLFDNGYLAKTKYAALERITEQAKQIRKER